MRGYVFIISWGCRLLGILSGAHVSSPYATVSLHCPLLSRVNSFCNGAPAYHATTPVPPRSNDDSFSVSRFQCDYKPLFLALFGFLFLWCYLGEANSWCHHSHFALLRPRALATSSNLIFSVSVTENRSLSQEPPRKWLTPLSPSQTIHPDILCL